MACPRDASLLTAYIDDELSAEERQALDGHLAVCASCREQARLLGDVRRTLLTMDTPAAPAPTWSALSRPSAAGRRARPRRAAWRLGLAFGAATIAIAWALPTLLQRGSPPPPPVAAPPRPTPDIVSSAPQPKPDFTLMDGHVKWERLGGNDVRNAALTTPMPSEAADPRPFASAGEHGRGAPSPSTTTRSPLRAVSEGPISAAAEPAGQVTMAVDLSSGRVATEITWDQPLNGG
jgi:anti-sigma factor RsiW